MSHHVTEVVVACNGNEYRITKTKIVTSDGRTLRRDACRAALAAILAQSPESKTRHRSALLRARHWFPTIPEWRRYCDKQAYSVLTLAHAPSRYEPDTLGTLVATQMSEPLCRSAELPTSLSADPIDIDDWLDSGRSVSELFSAMQDGPEYSETYKTPAFHGAA
jgi:hypothetical protein